MKHRVRFLSTLSIGAPVIPACRRWRQGGSEVQGRPQLRREEKATLSQKYSTHPQKKLTFEKKKEDKSQKKKNSWPFTLRTTKPLKSCDRKGVYTSEFQDHSWRVWQPRTLQRPQKRGQAGDIKGGENSQSALGSVWKVLADGKCQWIEYGIAQGRRSVEEVPFFTGASPRIKLSL